MSRQGLSPLRKYIVELSIEEAAKDYFTMIAEQEEALTGKTEPSLPAGLGPPPASVVPTNGLIGSIEPTLRPYQQAAVDRMVKMKRIVLADQMGLGKTPVSLSAGLVLQPHSSYKSVLVVCPKYAFGTWEREVKVWMPEDTSMTFTGSPTQRKAMMDDYDVQPFTRRPRVVICNFEQLKNLVAWKKTWPLVIVDEAHVLRHGRTKHSHKRIITYDYMMDLMCKNLFILTGSPMIAGPQDLWALLHLIDKQRFGSYWKFVEKYCGLPTKTLGDGTVVKDYSFILGPSKAHKFKMKHDVGPMIIRRLKKDVLKDLPDKQRQEIPTDMSPEQAEFYHNLARDMIATCQDGSLLLAPNKMVQMLRLRQILVSPLLVDPSYQGTSGAIEALYEFLDNIPAYERKAVVFTPFAQAVPIIKARLASLHSVPADGLPLTIETIQGGMRPEDLNGSRERFQERRGNKILIATIGVAKSWDAQTANACFFLGYDWAPAMNEQAEDRLHRYGQHDSVNCYYFVHRKTVDMHLLGVLNNKTSWTELAKDDPKTFLMPSL